MTGTTEEPLIGAGSFVPNNSPGHNENNEVETFANSNEDQTLEVDLENGETKMVPHKPHGSSWSENGGSWKEKPHGGKWEEKGGKWEEKSDIGYMEPPKGECKSEVKHVMRQISRKIKQEHSNMMAATKIIVKVLREVLDDL